MQKPPDDCGLCLAKDEAYRLVYKDDFVVVVVVREPMKLGHMMILPVRHVREVSELNPDEAHAFLNAVDACMHAVEDGFDEGPMCFLNGWKFRTQEHLHVHVMPCVEGMREMVCKAEGIPARIEATKPQLTKMAKQLRTLLKS